MSSKDVISGFTPAVFWERFYEITQTPRPSGKEEKITAYLEHFFSERDIDYSKDSVGNMVARVPASPGYEKAPVAVLQAHSDMVCVKVDGSAHNFDTDPIDLQLDGGWLTANGTTLGADNGIGLAGALAIVADPDVLHGPLEILVTVDEERGLKGAKQLPEGFVKGAYLLNMDSEEHGAFYIGCAGGVDSLGIFDVEKMPLPSGEYLGLLLKIDGLKGGHSGADIHMGRANAIKLLARTLHELRSLPVHLAFIKGGEARNVLPPKAHAILAVPVGLQSELAALTSRLAAVFNAEYQGIENNITVTTAATELPTSVFTDAFASKVVQTLLALPHGVVQMSADVEGLVETSTNLATIDIKDETLTIGTSQRSSVESAKLYIAESVRAVLSLAGAKVEGPADGGYPGWKPDIHSPLLKLFKAQFKALFKAEPEIKAIHAGLECGILKHKYPQLDAISFGPNITGAHSPQERVEVASVQHFYDLLKSVLYQIATQQ